MILNTKTQIYIKCVLSCVCQHIYTNMTLTIVYLAWQKPQFHSLAHKLVNKIREVRN